MEQKFLKCNKCGNVVAAVYESGVPVMCCGEKMQQILPNTVDASHEKHVPVFEVKDNIVHVQIGSVEHPMIPEHYIPWITVQSKLGNQRKFLQPGEAPRAEFTLWEGDSVEAVYAYCNLHGLWVKNNE